jgi:hypothetical protein
VVTAEEQTPRLTSTSTRPIDDGLAPARFHNRWLWFTRRANQSHIFLGDCPDVSAQQEFLKGVLVADVPRGGIRQLLRHHGIVSGPLD